MCGGVFFFLFNSIFKIPFLNIRKPPPFGGPSGAPAVCTLTGMVKCIKHTW